MKRKQTEKARIRAINICFEDNQELLVVLIRDPKECPHKTL
jgi:hypothetical protein